MAIRKKKDSPDKLIAIAAEAMSDKLAIDPLLIDFTGIRGAVCDFFLICHGSSRPQVEAIADHVTALVKKKTGQAPVHVEGLENAEWVLIDYFDVIIHVFQEPRRKFYNLEQLWADAKITPIAG